jgi:hypothetical protein
MINTERLLEELRFITLHPEKHNQSLWAEAVTPKGKRPSACGSFGCLAGNAVIHEGHDLLWKKEDETWDDKAQKWRQTWIADNVAGVVEGIQEPDPEIEVVARNIFGLTFEQGEILFDGDNTRDRIWECARFITANEPTPITVEDEENAKAEAAELRAAEEAARLKRLANARKRVSKIFAEFPGLRAEFRASVRPSAW